MSASSTRPLGLLDCTNHSHPPRAAPGPADSRAYHLTDAPGSEPESELRCAYPQDTINYHSTFLNTNIPSTDGDDWAAYVGLEDQRSSPSLDRSANSFPGGAQQQNKSQLQAYSLTVRASNRTHGSSLATIVEQGSCSTLKSHGSLMTVNRIRSTIGSISATALSYAAPRIAKSPEHQALHRIYEYSKQEATNEEVRPSKHGVVTDLRGEASQATVHEWQPTDAPLRLPTQQNDTENKRSTSILRSVLENVRLVSRTSNYSTPLTNPLSSSHGEILECAAQRADEQNHGATLPEGPSGRAPIDDAGPACTQPLLSRENYDENDRRPSYASENSFFGSSPVTIIHVPPARCQHEEASPSILGPSQGSSSPSEDSDISCRDAITSHNCVQTTVPSASSRSRDDVSTRYTFDGVPLHRTDAASLYEDDRARDASLCSSNSTTYSGAILGIDLDLRQNLPSRRGSPSLVPNGQRKISQSKSNNGSYSLHPREVFGTIPSKSVPWRSATTKGDATRSITSSALPVLLPLAAASGIVHANHELPHLSFISPSGNLIQTEPSSPTTSSPGSPIPYPYPLTYSLHEQLWARDPPARPALLPATTPPSLRAPLPGHLRPQQGHHRHAHLHIVPQMTVSGSNEVKGCDGVIRARSLQPRSGVKRSDNPAPSTTSQSHRPDAPQYFRSRLRSAGRLIETQWKQNSCNTGKRHAGTRNLPLEESPNSLDFGAAAAWALRICFCQPWDGVGKQADGCLGDADRCSRTDHANIGNDGELIGNARVVHRRTGRGPIPGTRTNTVGDRATLERRDSGISARCQ